MARAGWLLHRDSRAALPFVSPALVLMGAVILVPAACPAAST